MTSPIDRRLFAAGVLAAPLLPASAAFAQAVRSLRIVAPAGPGGGYDQLARAIQEALTGERLVGSVQVVNAPGAGGTIGLAGFVNARDRDPSAITVGLGLVGAPIINKSPVSLAAAAPLARLQGEYQPLFVAANSPLRTVNDLVARFKADPGSVTWGGFALGSPDHLLSGLVVKASGGDVRRMNYVAVGAGGEMLPLVMNGKVTVATGGLNEVAGQFKAGRLRPLGLSSPERLPGIDIPTFREQGVDAVLVNWRGLMAPVAMEAADRTALEAAIAAMVRSAPWRKLLAEREWVDLYMPAKEFGAFLADEQARIGALLGDLGLA